MAAKVEIDEQNGKSDSPILTHNISHTNMGTADAPNLNPINCPIIPGENSCEKWQLFHVSDIGTSTRITNLRIWRTGNLGDGAIHMTNLTSSAYTGATTYTTPTTTTSAVAKQVMPTSAPATANLGINGSLSGNLVGNGYSDFFIQQIQTTPKAVTGNTTTLNYQYDEFA